MLSNSRFLQIFCKIFVRMVQLHGVFFAKNKKPGQKPGLRSVLKKCVSL